MNNIRKIRKEKGISVKELAELTEISEAYIYHLENGIRVNPSYKTIKKLSKILGNEIFYL